MKKIIVAIMATLSMSVMSSVTLSGCSNGEKVSWMGDLTGYVASIQDATALGISKKAGEENEVDYQKTGVGEIKIAYASTQNSYAKKGGDKNYIIKTTNEYSANAPESTQSGIVRVTFKKTEGKEGENDKAVITQDEVGGEIDKLYVMENYTFVSYVPEGSSKRPADVDLSFDTDGIAAYDKCDYFSSSDRQSFIIDNTTGYIYKIKNFYIKKISGGCLLSSNDNLIYDFKINERDEVEIFSLFQNDNVVWFSCFKDKYGNKFIQNNRLILYDESTNTYFYVFSEPEHEIQFLQNVNYELTSNNECIQIVYDNSFRFGQPSEIIDASIILENGKKRDLTLNDVFDVYYDTYKANNDFHYSWEEGSTAVESVGLLGSNDEYWGSNRSINNRAVCRVENGVLYGYSHFTKYTSGFTVTKYDAVMGQYTEYTAGGAYYNVKYLEKYGIVTVFFNGTLYYYYNIFGTLDGFEAGNYSNTLSLTEDCAFQPIKVLENCSLSDDYVSVLTYGVAGNTYYDIVAEEIDGEIVIKQYVKGTYQKPQIKVVLQPLNR